MTDVRPGIIISVGAMAAAFAREIARRLDSNGPFAEFVHQVDVRFDPACAAVAATPGERLSSALLPGADADDAKNGLGRNAETLYRLLASHHTRLLDGFERDRLRLLDCGLNLRLPLEYLFIAPAHEPAAAWLALHMAQIIAEGLGTRRNDSFRMTALYLLPETAAMPEEQVLTYEFLAELDGFLDRQQARQELPRIAFENVMLADLDARLRLAAEAEASVPENPITEGAAKLFSDIDVFRQCDQLGINVREKRVRGRAARFSGVGAHFLEYDGAQLQRVMRNSLVRDFIGEIMLATPQDKDIARTVLERRHREFRAILTDVLTTAARETQTAISDKATSTIETTVAAAEGDAQEKTCRQVAAAVYGPTRLKLPRTAARIETTLAEMKRWTRERIDEQPWSFQSARILTRLLLAEDDPYFEALGRNFTDTLNKQAAQEMGRVVLALAKEFARASVEKWTARFKRNTPQRLWSDVEVTESHLQSLVKDARDALDQPEMNPLDLQRFVAELEMCLDFITASSVWPCQGAHPIDAQTERFINAMQLVWTAYQTQRQHLAEEINRIDEERDALAVKYGPFKRWLKRRQYKRALQEIGSRRAQCEMRMQELDAQRAEMIQLHYTRALQHALGWRQSFDAAAGVLDGVRALRDTLESGIERLTAEGAYRQGKIDAESYNNSALRTLLMDANAAQHVYRKKRDDLSARFEEWLAFPKGRVNRTQKAYDNIEKLSEFLERGMECCIEKLADFVKECYEDYANLPVAEIMNQTSPERTETRIQALMDAARPQLSVNRALDLGGYAIPQLTFMGIHQGENAPLATAARTIDNRIHFFDNHMATRIELYRFVFGVPGFALEGIRHMRQAYLNAIERDNKDTTDLPELFPEDMRGNTENDHDAS